MPVVLDKIDLAVIKSLAEDGRKSFRQISREIKISTPTIETRFERLKKMGIIKSVRPIINLEKIDNIIQAMMFIKTSPLSFEYVVSALNAIPEVTNLYSTTGEFHLTCIVITQNNTKLYDIIQRISKIKGIESINYQTITKILKDNQDISIEKQASMKINCDYCNNPIHASSSKILNTNSFEKFFCCSSCITLYQEKNNLFVK